MGDDPGLRASLGFKGGHVSFNRRVYVGPEEWEIPQSLSKTLKTDCHLAICQGRRTQWWVSLQCLSGRDCPDVLNPCSPPKQQPQRSDTALVSWTRGRARPLPAGTQVPRRRGDCPLRPVRDGALKGKSHSTC